MSNQNSIILSIVICTYNRADLLPVCLQRLSEQTLSSDLFEIIVVDNNSTDATKQIVEDFSSKHFPVKYILETRQGPNFARNRGILESAGKYIACIDDDAKATPEWADLICKTFENVKPQPLAIGGKIIPWYEIQPPSWFTDDFETRDYSKKEGFLEKKKAKYGFASGNIALTKEVLDEYKGFGENFGIINGKFKVGEDTDLFHRIWKNNQEKADTIFWYEPKILVEHWTPARNWQISYRIQRSRSAGEALATIEQSSLFSKSFFSKLLFLLLQPIYLIINILKFNRPFLNNWLRFLQNIHLAIDYLKQSFSQTQNPKH